MNLSFVKSINAMADDVVYFGSWSVLWLYNAYLLNIEKLKRKKKSPWYYWKDAQRLQRIHIVDYNPHTHINQHVEYQKPYCKVVPRQGAEKAILVEHIDLHFREIWRENNNTRITTEAHQLLHYYKSLNIFTCVA